MHYEDRLNGLPHSYFLTLTYDEENIPKIVNEDTGEILRSGKTEDVTNFWKRLRIYGQRHVPRGTKFVLRYFGCLEYGTRRGRPHYHYAVWASHSFAEIFGNMQFSDLFNQFYIPKLTERWGLGFLSIEPFAKGHAKYIAKYQTGGLITPALQENIDAGVKRPRGYYSTGIGRDYLEDKRVVAYHRSKQPDGCYNMIMYVDGSPVALPRYYRRKIFNTAEILAHFEKYQEKLGDELARFDVTTYAELATKKAALLSSEMRKFKKLYYESKNKF